MTAVAGRALRIQSDLRLEVDGLSATVTADGNQVTVTTADVGRFLARATDFAPSIFGPLATPVSRLALVRRGGRLLDEVGLSARLVDGRGTVLEVGHGCGSRAGRVLFGSNNVRLGRPDALVPTAAAYVRAAWPGRVRSAAAGLAVALVVLDAARRRRRADRS